MCSFRDTGPRVRGKSGAGVRGVQSAPGLLPMRTMLLALACLLAGASAAPATYDQRQDGGFNVRADVQNVVLLVAYPSKLVNPFLAGLTKSANDGHGSELQERADVRVMEAFVEPSEPYHVEIGDSGRTADGGGGNARAVEVVIAGRRRLDSEPQPEAEQDELKLLGASEQCGPERERDPLTLACRARSAPAEPAAPPQPEPVQPQPEPARSQPEPEEKPQIASANSPSPEVVPVPS